MAACVLSLLLATRVFAQPFRLDERWDRYVRACLYCAGEAALQFDPERGDSFLFDSDGTFLARIRVPDAAARLVVWRGPQEAPLQARFADPRNDPATIDRDTRVHLVSPAFIHDRLRRTGVYDTPSRGLVGGCRFLKRYSGFNDRLDFAGNGEYSILPRHFYITCTEPEGYIAHNHYNFGNFLWGASARALGVPEWIARLGSHFNTFFLTPATKGMFDTPDDIFSISAGHHWRE